MKLENGRIRLALAIFCLPWAAEVFGQAPDSVVPLATALNSITENALQQHVNVLASDSLEGREAGTRGGHAAAAYIVDQLRKLGMRPAGADGEFFQPFGGTADYRNILCVVPGSDPAISNEFIVVGGHYDHVGYGNATNSFGPFGHIHNGADDNASGCSALLELMRAIRAGGLRPRRSILFAFWDGEEKNLLGSKHFVTAPLVPLEQIKLVINVDMVGRLTNSRMEMLGTRTAVGLRRFVSERNTEEIDIDFNWDIIGDSDHYPFVQRQIPYLMPFTDKHADYHRPSDDPDKINVDGMRRVTRLILRLLTSACDMESLPTYRPRCRVESEGTRRGFERPLPPADPRFGVQTTTGQNGEVLVQSVIAGTPAAISGIRAGDSIVSFGGVDVSAESFRRLVQSAAGPVEVQIRRTGQPMTVNVQLSGSPVRIGIAWRTNACEPGTKTLTRVIPGTPGAAAGLAVGDRIYSLNGQPTTSDEQFLSDIRDARRLNFRVERKGRIFEATVVPLPVTQLP